MKPVQKTYRIIFAGTPQFSVPVLSALIHSRHTVKAVYTQPDRPAGRGRKLTPSPIKELALQHQLPIHQPMTLRDEEQQRILASFKADLMVVVAYGLLLPLPVLQAPTLGCINIHASLLPRWRGAAPIQRAILAGDTMTGITIMQMNKGLDTGDMLYKTECSIGSNETSAILHEKLSHMGSDALIQTLDQLSNLQPETQDNSKATYAHKITKEEAKLDWTLSAIELDRKIRAFNPWPIAFTHCGEHIIRIFDATVLEQKNKVKTPGVIVDASAKGIDVATGDGILRIHVAQLPGGKPLPVLDLLNARQTDFAVGKVLL